MNFNTNQNRQFYVANSVAVKNTPSGAEYLVIEEVKGNTVRTDFLTNVEYINMTSSKELEVEQTVVTATLDEKYTVGTPVLLEVSIPDYIGGGDEYSRSTILSLEVESATTLTAVAAGTEGKPNKFEKNLSKAFPEYEFKVSVTAKTVVITSNYKVSNWRLGVSPMRVVTVNISGKHVIETVITEGNPISKTGNMILAELEYFCKGERGDQYRMMGYPNVIPSKYDIDINTAEYTVFDIHCAYVGPNEMVQKSEKDITIVVVGDGANTKTELNKLTAPDVIEPTTSEAPGE